MKKRFYVFKSEYKNLMDGTGQTVNTLTLVATFEDFAEKEAIRFASNSAMGPLFVWTIGGESVEKNKR